MCPSLFSPLNAASGFPFQSMISWYLYSFRCSLSPKKFYSRYPVEMVQLSLSLFLSLDGFQTWYEILWVKSYGGPTIKKHPDLYI